MEEIRRKCVDWAKTGKVLEELRLRNMNVRRYTCFVRNYDKGDCNGDCENCRYDMDKSISRQELASVFQVSESVVFNWENGKTAPRLEDLMLYCDISGVMLPDILIFS